MTHEEITSQLDQLRIRPITVEIPYAQAGKHVHFYLVEDSRPALFDSGFFSDPNGKAIEKALRKYGYEMRDIQRVYLTHGHADHYGNAVRFQRLGAEVFLHPGDFNKVMNRPTDETDALKLVYAAEFTRHGFPAALVTHLDGLLMLGVTSPNKLESPTPVADGDVFTFDRFNVRTVAVPGHTPGCVSYFFGDSGVAVTGDHLLHNISPNPIFELSIEGNRFPSLVRYFESLEKILNEGLRMALPAHGPFVTDPRALIQSMAAFYQRRQGKLFNMLDTPADAFALCQTYYRRLKDFEIFLGFSEIMGNLEMMAHRGEIALGPVGDRDVYRRVASAPIPLASFN